MRQSRRAAVAPRGGASAVLAILTLAGCGLDLSGLGLGTDAGRDGAMADSGLDGSLPDGAAPDGWEIDAGPPCPAFEEAPEVLTLFGAEALLGGEATLDGVELETPGQLALALQPYRYGALLATGFDDGSLADPPRLTDLEAATPAGSAFRRDFADSWDAASVPPGLSLDPDGVYAVSFEGEIRLRAGDNGIELQVADRGVLELDVDGRTTRLSPTGTDPTWVMVAIPRDDWYPVRIALSAIGDGARISVRFAAPGESLAPAEPEDLRVDVRAVQGRDAWGFDSDTVSLDPDGDRIDTSDSDHDFARETPEELGISGPDDWSIRWVGRMRFDSARGPFSSDGDDTHRVWVDGVFVEGHYGSAHGEESHELGVPRGWHDVVFELEEGSGDASARLQHRDQTFAPDAMRPRTRFGGRAHGQGLEVFETVTAGTTSEQRVSLSGSGPPTLVEVSAVVETEEPEAVTLDVVAPTGHATSLPLHLHGRRTDEGLVHLRAVPTFSRTLASADGEWVLSLENRGRESLRWTHAGVLGHWGGTADAYPSRGEIVSRILDLGADATIEAVRSLVDLPFGTSVDLFVRGGRTPAETAASSWMAADGQGGVAGGLEARFFQLQFTLHGPGTDTPRIQEVRVVGRACRSCEADPAGCPAARERSDLVLLYDFEDGARGDPVAARARDMSGFYPLADVLFRDVDRVAFRDGAAVIESDTAARSPAPPRELREALQSSNEISVEMWLTPATTSQSGPARVLAVSRDTSAQNLMFGQVGNRWSVRLVSDGPAVELLSASSTASTERVHLVFVRGPDDTARIYVDGVESSSVDLAGPFSAWDPTHRLTLANEHSLIRDWLGSMHLVAIYARALTPEEIARHLALGP